MRITISQIGDGGVGVSEEAQEIAELVDLLPEWRRAEMLDWLRRYVRVYVADNRAVEVRFL